MTQHPPIRAQQARRATVLGGLCLAGPQQELASAKPRDHECGNTLLSLLLLICKHFISPLLHEDSSYTFKNVHRPWRQPWCQDKGGGA